jgi:antitoxin component of RelBE/YafQ-DinJ toxin-antitoxin module
MTGQTISTSIRVEKATWRQIKAVAAEFGMSANQYINYLIEKLIAKQELGEYIQEKSEEPIWRLNDLPTKRGKGLKKEDKQIYY